MISEFEVTVGALLWLRVVTWSGSFLELRIDALSFSTSLSR